ncbi:PGM2 [Symbiodinium sp. KB8]|nr:PGM2 [Symbiodinium sp. KB8]
MLASTVSSKMIGAMARANGFHFEETLTGFKWMGNRAAALQAEGKTVLFSFEEAIGFCLGDTVLDKDGVAAAAVFTQMAGTLAAQGKRVADQMTALYEEYGYFVTNNGYLFITDAGTVPGIFERLINGGKYQDALRQWKVASIRDLHGAGVDTSQPDGKPTLPTSASTHMLTYTFENGAVITLRTSGTEPKLKYYAEMAAGTPQAATAELQDMVDAVIEDMLQPEANKLRKPGQ